MLLELITSHNALDFDGLAAMVAAGKLYPGAVKVFSGTLSKNVKQFLALYKDSLIIKSPKEIPTQEVRRMIVVDTARASRLGHLKKLAEQPDMEFHVFDHHPLSADSLPASLNVIEPVGAATTLLVEKIMEQNIALSSFDATVLALGIYEDTGSLLYSSTTARDAAAVAYLLGRGANLSVVANFMDQPFSGEQRQILQSLLNTVQHIKVHNLDVVVAQVESEIFVPGLDAVTFRLSELENCDAIFVVAKMEDRIHVIGRSRSSSVKVNEILRPLGGGGHERAASVVVKDQKIEEIIDIVMNGLGEKAHPALLAGDIMSTPVKTIGKDISMEEAGRIMLRYGHTGMPVVEGDKMVGVISRRDVDKARIHNLGHAPVKGFMTTSVLAVTPDTPVSEVQHLMVEHDVGRLPVVSEGRLIGIVSRTDILRTLHGEDYPEDHQVLFSYGGGETENCAELLTERLPSKLMSILRMAGEAADHHGASIYCVGGFVRDLFLQVPNFDVDFVVEGEGEKVIRDLAHRLGGKERIHERFQTAVISLPDGTKLDVATARTEYYEFPAALPTVEKSSIREDLYRRDFTINTLAICLNPDRFGNLIDYFGGRKDIDQGLIRILYNFSFVEDPTRILRAIRFEQRYGFNIEADTLRFAQDAIDRKLLGKLSYKRILQELILILGEKDPWLSLDRMKDIGVWQYVLPEVDLNTISRTTLKRIPILKAWWSERYHKTNIRTWLIYMMVLLHQLSEEQVEDIFRRYSLDLYAQQAIRESRLVPDIIQQLKLNNDLPPSYIYSLIGSWHAESSIFLLLSLRDEQIYEAVTRYLDARDRTRIETDGHLLKEMGIKPGPIFSQILGDLYQLRLDGAVTSKDEEAALVAEWIKEGKYSDD